MRERTIKETEKKMRDEERIKRERGRRSGGSPQKRSEEKCQLGNDRISPR
jgi:ribosome assembly protein YihI (activator of Der GTPase)